MHTATKYALLAATLSISGLGGGFASDKKILLIAGRPSHGPGDHEFRAGSLLLQNCLNKVKGIKAEMHDFGWPKDDSAFDGADAVLIYADGGGGHPAIQKKVSIHADLSQHVSAWKGQKDLHAGT